MNNRSLRQECLNVGFYCKDMRAKMDADIKKHLDRQNFDPNNGPKKHLRNTNKSAMIVANRVLDCREEVLGFFKQQVLKVKREERLAQEEHDMLAEKLKTSKENSQGRLYYTIQLYTFIPFHWQLIYYSFFPAYIDIYFFFE